MKNYELNYLLNPKLSEEEAKTLVQKIISHIQEEKGIVNPVKENLDKIRLAYPIKKTRTAYFDVLKFVLEPDNLENLEKKLKEIPELLRYMIVVQKITKESKKPTRIRKIKTTISATEKTKEKVELKEIEKKLEEILGE